MAAAARAHEAGTGEGAYELAFGASSPRDFWPEGQNQRAINLNRLGAVGCNPRG
jgi:hypothetical protein